MPTSSAEPPAKGARHVDWWEREDLRYDDEGCLWFGGARLADLARRTGTPAYVYSGRRIAGNVARLRAALARLGPPAPRLYYAMKANRSVGVLNVIRELGVGIDVCSPGEVRLALRCGFMETELSFTAGSLSADDLAALGAWPQLWINADSLTALRHVAAISPGRRLGLRVNPGQGVGYRANPLLRYAGTQPTKFGVYLDRFEEALELARTLGLEIAGLHVHAGCGFLTPQLPAVDAMFEQVSRFLALAPWIKILNLGGGLGIPLVAEDRPLDLEAWVALIGRHFGGRGLTLAFEPGDYLVKDAGILLTEVAEVEAKGGRTFVGLNAGFNLHPEPAFYHLPLAPVAACRRPGPVTEVTVSGNLNEALDLWAEDVPMPPLAERDVVCLLNAGGYGAAMASAHCLRGDVNEHVIDAGSLDVAVPADLAEANQRAWDRLYASTPDLIWGTTALPFLCEFIADFRDRLQPASRLLDAAAGEGRNLRLLRQFGAAELHALDSSAHALEKIPVDLKRQVCCRHASLRATGYPDNYFDGVALLDAIETIPDPNAVLAEIARILKPGGLLLCNIPGLEDGIAGIDMEAIGRSAFLYRQCYYFQFIERHEAEALLKRSGFDLLRCSRCQWHEPPHPGFRAEEHVHVSHVFLACRPPRAAVAPLVPVGGEHARNVSPAPVPPTRKRRTPPHRA